MKCYHHPDRDAVGVCRACGRGLCSACAVDLHRGLACPGPCEAQARALVQFEDQQLASVAAERSWWGARGRDALYFVAYMVVGGVFVWWSRVGYFPFPSVSLVVLTIGICLVSFGVLNILRAVVTWVRGRRARGDATG